MFISTVRGFFKRNTNYLQKHMYINLYIAFLYFMELVLHCGSCITTNVKMCQSPHSYKVQPRKVMQNTQRTCKVPKAPQTFLKHGSLEIGVSPIMGELLLLKHKEEETGTEPKGFTCDLMNMMENKISATFIHCHTLQHKPENFLN